LLCRLTHWPWRCWTFPGLHCNTSQEVEQSTHLGTRSYLPWIGSSMSSLHYTSSLVYFTSGVDGRERSASHPDHWVCPEPAWRLWTRTPAGNLTPYSYSLLPGGHLVFYWWDIVP
jgi:hypothetical protein